MNKTKYITLLLLSGLILTNCGGEEEGGFQGQNRTVPAVEAVQAQFGSLPLEERLSGTVRAGNQVEIFSRISAPVEEVYVESGESVERGEVLVQLRDNEYRERLRQAEANLRITKAQLRQAEAALGEVEADLNRQRILAERDLVTDMEMEQLAAEVESAEASVELSNAQVEQAESTVQEQKDALEQTTIRAPISGTVGDRAAETGMQATPNNRLFVIGDLSRSKITINVTERMLQYIESGQSVRIYSENFPDTVLTGEVSRISPFLGEGSFSTQAEIDVQNPDRLLLPGMFVTVDVLYGESEQATLIPLSAIYNNPQTGETGVYVAPGFGIETEILEEIEDNGSVGQLSNPTEVEFVPIEVIAKGREAAGVAGIQSGDWVVTVGQNLLVRDQGDDARVRATSWEKIMNMQKMQPQDLLQEILNNGVADQSTAN
ncbi:efflux RND transporter periplasmic adaptor subunit [Rhodohalobacter barkolensis]|uniref:Efflux RND transporter periplasmic adaptor subunit n=1 Tax=Rhodohalobacter barkolensis TaxID=2053187 RepID=A0A2N0VEK7_9BACT|nr:efflux RND transporter periplasmic adaptor subunit [Rhodohalobacter barkolensis]PKD42634.1 efflux RND transporter periplasmic adaptor subunit [Rhodohalobacter barkolensis]